MDDIEMVKRYAHLSPNNLNEHARQIDAIFNDCVPNMSHETDLKLEINAK
ncbi:integrase [Yersinia intermedia]|nr:integrase [Yersinia sp. FDAARGOS_228]AVL38261.1 integrase [Yersinia intermedia]OWF91856.1 integrase [Yersinia intermedia]